MGIGIKTHKLLWGKSGSRCAICKKGLLDDESETDDPAIVGEECHIVAQSNNGPRADSSFPIEKKDRVDNLILLCRNHHKIVDDQPQEYTVEKLYHIKREHEEWVKNTLGFSSQLDQDSLKIAENLDKWPQLANIENWRDVYSGITIDGIPRIFKETMYSLESLRDFLISRFREPKYSPIEEALDNFNRILNDFINIFRFHAIENDYQFRTERFYKISNWNPERYKRLHEKYMAHVAIVEDLFYELTRAANLVIVRVRKNLQSNYRQKEGLILVDIGPDSSFKITTSRPEYNEDDNLYQSLEKFVYNSSRRLFAYPEDKETIDEYCRRFSS